MMKLPRILVDFIKLIHQASSMVKRTGSLGILNKGYHLPKHRGLGNEARKSPMKVTFKHRPNGLRYCSCVPSITSGKIVE